jgi:hypothetical protein
MTREPMKGIRANLAKHTLCAQRDPVGTPSGEELWLWCWSRP